MRLERSLAGSWDFQLDSEGTVQIGNLAPDRQIPVPLPWQVAFPELDQYSGYAWYVTSFDLDADWLAGDLLLTFGAVDYWCQVFVNGQFVGEHEGGYTRFTFLIREQARAGANQLAVRVYDSVQSSITIPRWFDGSAPQSHNQPPFDAREVPHGKQEWYRNVGGIWQAVTLTAVSAAYVRAAHVTPDIHTGMAMIQVELGGDLSALAGSSLRAALADGSLETTASLVNGQSSYTLSLGVPEMQLWTPETPHLYTLTVSLEGGQADDALTVRFGFREITTRDGQLWLNGQPLFLLSALDQDLYPETIYTVPSDDYLRDQFTKAKQLGLNNLRVHIKPPDPRYLDLADEMGLLVWAEIPSWRTFVSKSTAHPESFRLSETIHERARQTLHEMIARDYNHPSVIIWTIVNEDWGTTLPLSAEDRAWIAGMYDLCKQLDPTRLVVDNSACGSSWGPNIHVKTDIDDFHLYFNIPDQAAGFTQALEQFALRPLWTFSNQGDAQRTGDEPLILSEFGNWGLPSLRGLLDEHGNPPDWFSLGPWWSPWDGEPGWPRGVAERFERLGLTAIWPDYEAFATASQWHQFAAMKFEIETMRRLPILAGYVITEFTDAYWESNGLLDFNRCPKVYHAEFPTINAPDVLIAQLDRYSTWDDQAVPAQLHSSHFGAADWTGGSLTWTADGLNGQSDVPAQARGSVMPYGVTRWHMPTVDRATAMQVTVALHGSDGAELAHNSVEVLVLPSSARQAAFTDPVSVITRRTAMQADASKADSTSDSAPHHTDTATTPDSPPKTSSPADVPTLTTHPTDLVSALTRLGYQTHRRITPDTRLAVSDYADATLLEWVRSGGDLLYLNTGIGPFFWAQGRSGAYGGNWMSSFNWLRPGVYRRLSVTSPLGLPFARIAPQSVIVGLPVNDSAYHADFLAGQITGWIGHPALHTVQFRYGAGRVVMTTYSFKEPLMAAHADPVAVAMLHDLIDHLTSDACQPTLRAHY